jgi:hypothetical protein
MASAHKLISNQTTQTFLITKIVKCFKFSLQLYGTPSFYVTIYECALKMP